MIFKNELINRILYHTHISPEEIAEYKEILKCPDMPDEIAVNGLLYIRYCAELVIEAQMKGELEELRRKYGFTDKDDAKRSRTPKTEDL